MTFGIQFLATDAHLLPMSEVTGYVTSDHEASNGVSYYEFATAKKRGWELWREALDAANRPYKYIIGVNGKEIPINDPNW